jgi:hypothetical protein
LEFANNGIHILSKEIQDISNKNKQDLMDLNSIENEEISPVKPISEEYTEEQKKSIAIKREKNSLLAIAYYNAGSQLEFLKSYKEWIDSFNRSIYILERNFAPNYPLTIEFKKTLSKAIQKYQNHLSWKGYNRTFSNLNEQLVSKRVSSCSSRPTSAAMTSKMRTQPTQGKGLKLRYRSRPFTAKTKHTIIRNKLTDSASNPFGSPDNEECLFSFDEKPKEEGSTADINPMNIDTDTRKVTEHPVGKLNSKSPIFGHAKRFKRPQSAKPTFENIYQLRK